MSRVQANGIEIAFDIQGAGAPLLLVGGFGMTRDYWGRLPELLSTRFRVITFDNRGAGASTIPETPFSIGEMAWDAIGLLDALQVDQGHLFGVSMGGMISQVLCANYPGRVGKAILCCTGHGGRHAVPPQPKVAVTFREIADPGLSPEKAARMLLPLLFSKAFVSDNPDGVEAYVRLCVEHPMTPAGAKGQKQALMTFDAEELPSRIAVPVLVVTGSDDLLMPPGNSTLLAAKIPGAKLELIRGAGHNFFFERPETTAALIEAFLTGPAAPTTRPEPTRT